MLRPSDTDREQTAGRLDHAASEGRLSADELEQRLEATFCARTYGELGRLVCDLPSDREAKRRHRLAGLLPLRPRIALALAALLVALMVSVAAAGIGFGRSSAVAAPQPRAPANTQVSTTLSSGS